MNRSLTYKLKISIFVLALFSSSCASETNNSQKPVIVASLANDVTKVSSSNSLIKNDVIKKDTIVTSPNDEQEIKDFINSNQDYFPLDANGDFESSQATVPNNGGVVFATVPNNGGVVFAADQDSFATKALVDKIATNLEKLDNLRNNLRKLKDRVKTLLPQKWGRKLIEKPKREISITFESSTKAKASIKTVLQRELVVGFAERNLAKKLIENSVREAFFVKENNKWVLESLSPFDFKVADKNTDLKFEKIKLVVTNKEGKTSDLEISLNTKINKKDIPTISRGDILTVEVTAKNTKEVFDPPLYAYLRIPSLNLRLPMFDDGSKSDIYPETEGTQSSSDREENDNIYTTSIQINKNVGIKNLTIDILAGGSFDGELSDYDALSKSIPIIIK